MDISIVNAFNDILADSHTLADSWKYLEEWKEVQLILFSHTSR